MNLYQDYEEQFIDSINTIAKKIEALSQQSHHKKELAFNDIKADLTDCQKHLKLMETETASMPLHTKLNLLKKVRTYRKDFDINRKGLYRAEQDYVVEKNREMLIGAELDQGQNHSSKLIRQGQVLSDTTYKLRDGVKVMHQTLDISHSIGDQLEDHTGRLIGNTKKLGGMREDLTKSGKIVRTMMNRIRKNKFILFSVLGIIFLVVIIIMGIYFSNKGQ